MGILDMVANLVKTGTFVYIATHLAQIRPCICC